MRKPLLALLAAATACLALAPIEAEAQSRRARDRLVVLIVPSYLTTGTQVGPNEFRAAVPHADARFRAASVDLPGVNSGPYWTGDALYLRHPHSTIVVDTAFGSKSPGER